MNIELSKNQLKYLIKLVYLGNWVVNSKNEPEAIDENYERVASLIYSYGEKAGLKKYVAYGKHSRTWTETDYLQMKSDAAKLLNEYNDNNFWSHLIDNFALRDFHNKYSAKKIRKMSNQERFEKFYKFIDQYTDETNDHGIERFSIIKQIPEES